MSGNRDAVDDLLAIASTTDWISPLIGLIQDAAYGPSEALQIDGWAGWSGREIVKLLRDNGVKAWGATVTNDAIAVSVKKVHAKWARAVLARAGVPLL